MLSGLAMFRQRCPQIGEPHINARERTFKLKNLKIPARHHIPRNCSHLQKSPKRLTLNLNLTLSEPPTGYGAAVILSVAWFEHFARVD